MDLDTFLQGRKSNGTEPITHTRIGYKKNPIIYGGSYSIPEKDMALF